jgi:predicted GIY-YIG superfamily endonuclease
MNKPVYIYSLVDPRDNKVKYIGKTVNLEKRMEQHLYWFTGTNPRKERWIQKLKDKGFKPEMAVIEECNQSNWMEREKYWIAYYREVCPDLTNIADGGENSWDCAEARNSRVRKIAARTGAEIKKCYVCGELTISHIEICSHCLRNIDPDFENTDWYQFLSDDHRKTHDRERYRRKKLPKCPD